MKREIRSRLVFPAKKTFFVRLAPLFVDVVGPLLHYPPTPSQSRPIFNIISQQKKKVRATNVITSCSNTLLKRDKMIFQLPRVHKRESTRHILRREYIHKRETRELSCISPAMGLDICCDPAKGTYSPENEWVAKFQLGPIMGAFL